MKKIIISILILFKELVFSYYPYTSRLQLQIKSNNKNLQKIIVFYKAQNKDQKLRNLNLRSLY